MRNKSEATIVVRGGDGLGHSSIHLNWATHKVPRGATDGIGHIAITIRLIGKGESHAMAQQVRDLPAIGWPLSAVQKATLGAFVKPAAPFPGVSKAAERERIAKTIREMVQDMVVDNAVKRRSTIAYQRKCLRDRFGAANVVLPEGGARVAPPFALVWERPMRGGPDAAARGLVKAKGGRPMLEHLLAPANEQGTTNHLSAQAVAEHLLRIESELLALGVRGNLLAGTEAMITPHLPKSATFWNKAKGDGVGYTCVRLLRMEAGSWLLVSAVRDHAKYLVQPVKLRLSIGAGIAAMTSHLRARNMDLKHEASWRMLRMLLEYREYLYAHMQMHGSVDTAFAAGTPIYDGMRADLIGWLRQDPTILGEIQNLDFTGVDTSDL